MTAIHTSLVIQLLLTAYLAQSKSLSKTKIPTGIASVSNSELWTPENGVSREEWLRCHGLPCNEWQRRQRKKLQLNRLYASQGENDDRKMMDTSNYIDPMSLQRAQLDGCIWLTEAQIDDLLDSFNTNPPNTNQSTSTPNLTMTEEQSNGGDTIDKESQTDTKSRQKRKVDSSTAYDRWPLPIVYKFDGVHDSNDRSTIRNAINHWEEYTCIKFKEIGEKQHHNDDHIVFTKEPSGCHSWIGKSGSREQQINLESVCLGHIGTSVHEIGHALGFWHEQQRYDRDTYVKVKYKNLARYHAQFNYRSGIYLGVKYDIGSIMHYAPKDGTRNGKNVMDAVDPLYQQNMGQRTGLSFNDAKAANRLYCLDKCANILTKECKRGGYQDPNNCHQCRCPPGFTGQYCEDVPYQIYGECGQAGVTLTDTENVKYVTSPGYSHGYYDNDVECTWHIKAPASHHIIMTFQGEFGLLYYPNTGCYHWVEVKYKGNLEEQGPRFCTENFPQKGLVSDGELMVIIFRTNYYVRSIAYRRGFQIKLKATLDLSSSVTDKANIPTERSTSTTTRSTTTTFKPTTPTSTTTTTSTPKPTTPTTTTSKPTTSTTITNPTTPTTTTSTSTTTTAAQTTTTTPKLTSTQKLSTTTTTVSTTQTATSQKSTPQGPTIPIKDCIKVDITFLLDSSGSVGEGNWKLTKHFVIDIISSIEMSKECGKLGIITYGNLADVYHRLNYSTNMKEMIKRIESIPFKNQWTNTAAGLRMLWTDLYQTKYGDRQSAANVVIIVTDGKSNIGESPVQVIQDIPTITVDILGIGIGNEVDKTELEGIAGSINNTDYINSYKQLFNKTFQNRLMSRIKAITIKEPEIKSDPTFTFECTFETAKHKSTLCGMVQDKKDTFDWKLTNKGTPSEVTGPAKGYSGDSYIYIEASSPRKKGDKARIELPAVPSTHSYCLSFNYHMYGHHIYQLNVYKLSPDGRMYQLWTKQGEKGNVWLSSGVTKHQLNQNDKIIFEGVRGDEYSGDIAVDNIILLAC